MATELAKAYVQIIPSADGISGSLPNILNSEASAAGESAGSKFGSSFGAVAKTGLSAVATAATAVASATVDMGKSLMNGVSSVAEYGDNIDKMSQKLGISAEAYQEWDAVMQHSGASIDSLMPGMKNLQNLIADFEGDFTKSRQELADSFKSGKMSVEEYSEAVQVHVHSCPKCGGICLERRKGQVPDGMAEHQERVQHQRSCHLGQGHGE